MFLLLIIVAGTIYFAEKMKEMNEEMSKAKKEAEDLILEITEWEEKYLENIEKKIALEEKYLEKNGG